MILVDFSSYFIKNLFNASKLHETTDVKKFSKTMFRIITEELLELESLYGDNEIVICLDDKSGKKLWRKEIYPMYKSNRTSSRNESEIDWNLVYSMQRDFVQDLESSLPYKIIHQETCEADDIILTLSDYCNRNKINCLILSPDKDFIQHHSEYVRQYSPIQQKFVESKDKDLWRMEHICLGDAGDGVPRIVDFKEFKSGVEEIILEKYGFNPNTNKPYTPFEFSNIKYNLEDFPDGVFVKPRFGIATLKKTVNSFGSLDNYINSDPQLKESFERNEKLVMFSGISKSLRESIIEKYHNVKVNNNVKLLEEKYSLKPEFVSAEVDIWS